MLREVMIPFFLMIFPLQLKFVIENISKSYSTVSHQTTNIYHVEKNFYILHLFLLHFEFLLQFALYRVNAKCNKK